MTASVQRDRQGPDWPLGLIVVPTPGTPVSIMSLVDSANANAPETATSTTTAEYTERAYQIIFTACKLGASSHGVAANTGNVYIVRRGVGSGTGNRDDQGSIVAVLPISTSNVYSTFILTAAALNRDVFSPYRYFIDSDVANEGALVTLVMQ